MPGVSGEGYQYSLDDLHTKVRAYLGQDADNSNFEDSELSQFISDTLNEMRLKGVRELAYNSFTTTEDDQTWTPPATVWKIVSMSYDDEVLQQITQADMDAMTDGDWDSSTGTPRYWFDDGQYIWFDVAFGDTKTVKYWYWKRRQDLSGEDDEPGYDKVYGPVIVAGVLKRCAWRTGNTGQYQIAAREFDGLLTDAQLHAQRLHEGEAPEQHDPYSWGSV